MEKQTGKQLLTKLKDGTITPQELKLLESWYEDYLSKEKAFDDAAIFLKDMEILDKAFPFHYEKQTGTRTTHKLWPRIVAVAAAMALIVIGVYFFSYNRQTSDNSKDLVTQDVAPGKVGATLTLASGKQIKLSDAVNGEIANEAGISVSKTADGQLVYEIKSDKGSPGKINTLSTAKGETYILTLPDKSKVWLNAASSLTYAASLIERGKRVVRLSGEGYFQVAKDKAHPFVVESGDQRVEVLGTHFNVSAYANDPQIKTTLEEGSIKIAFGAESRILKPNQQAVLSGTIIQVKDVDAELALAWKSGFFLFDRERLESIMDKLERWYDVDVIYSDPSLKSRIFTGTISRFEKISEVLNMLESTEGVRFKIEDRRIIISKRN